MTPVSPGDGNSDAAAGNSDSAILDVYLCSALCMPRYTSPSTIKTGTDAVRYLGAQLSAFQDTDDGDTANPQAMSCLLRHSGPPLLAFQKDRNCPTGGAGNRCCTEHPAESRKLTVNAPSLVLACASAGSQSRLPWKTTVSARHHSDDVGSESVVPFSRPRTKGNAVQVPPHHRLDCRERLVEWARTSPSSLMANSFAAPVVYE